MLGDILLVNNERFRRLQLLVRMIRDAENACEGLTELDNGEYLREAAELLCAARQKIWPVYYPMMRQRMATERSGQG